jgi:hypothetical protein
VSEGFTWQKSSFSGGGDGNHCVEMAATATGLALRESDDPAAVLTSTPARLRALLAAVKRVAGWQKSSFSGGGDGNDCLELATYRQAPVLRESEDPTIVLATTPARLAALLAALKEPIAG